VKGMKESNSEELATHAGPESCVVTREGGGEALTGVRIGRVSSRERSLSRGGRRITVSGRQHGCARIRWSNTRRVRTRSSAVLDPAHVRNHLARELGGLMFGHGTRWVPWSASQIQLEQCVDARA
jgi:hypothetical protein